jgi:hypothetical protein
MSVALSNMGLISWTAGGDFFSASDLSSNWSKVDAHDHTPGKGVQIPSGGLANGAVTGVKLAADAVDATKILDGSVGSAELASNAVTTTKITDASVTRAKISGIEARTALTLATGTWTSQNISCWKDQIGLVHLGGRAQSSAGNSFIANTVLFTLPVGYRPAVLTMGQVHTSSGVIQPININTDGTVTVATITIAVSTSQPLVFDVCVPFRTDA